MEVLWRQTRSEVRGHGPTSEGQEGGVSGLAYLRLSENVAVLYGEPLGGGEGELGILGEGGGDLWTE